MKFVKGINDSFESIRSRVLTIAPLRDINLVFNMAITDEMQQSCGSGPP